ncbi:MAG: sodium-dependent transporter [Eubacteriales bacterium]|nr:sodium-dependent transporter [Eubacteriales bacterium]
MERERFGSRLGFVLVSAGCAIGVGNVWRFPYVAGQNGGGVFVFFYILSLIFFGIPILSMELAIGRGTGKSLVKAYYAIEKPGQKWHIHGWVGFFGCFLLMMYYTTVAGWILYYFFRFLMGGFTKGMSGKDVEAVFTNLLLNPGSMMLWMGITVFLGFGIISFGLQNGLERSTKWMMTLLFLLIILLAVRGLLLPGAKEGLRFYLYPDFAKARKIGIWKVITAAMSQSFFTLGLGVGSMEIFGSYMDRKHTLISESVMITALDTVVAVLAGLVIFPACYSYGVKPASGPPLLFMTLPNVFLGMKGGRIWGSLFFLFMTFASFSTVMAVFENLIANSMDLFGWTRKKAAGLGAIIMFFASLPCLLGYNVWSGISVSGKNILDLEDFLLSNILLPVGTLTIVLFCVTKAGWGFENYLSNVNEGNGIKLSRNMRHYLGICIPLMIIIIFVQGLIG